ncbi:hypothetical protein [Campylobacter phage CJLB-14]|nr:hypothetical protein [Campylobacter phage CJLB-14]
MLMVLLLLIPNPMAVTTFKCFTYIKHKISLS